MTGLVCDSFIFLTIFPNIKQLDFPVQIVFSPNYTPLNIYVSAHTS